MTPKKEKPKPDALYTEGNWQAEVFIEADISDIDTIRYRLRVHRELKGSCMRPGTVFTAHKDRHLPQASVWNLYRYEKR